MKRRQMEKHHKNLLKTTNPQSAENFDNRFPTASNFLSGAEFYLDHGNFNFAAFMLHQATEHALSAVIFSITGIEIRTHKLSKLLRYCSFSAITLRKIFECKTEMDRKLFKRLGKAYKDALHKETYTLTKNQVYLLYEKVKELHEGAIALCVKD